MTRWRVAALLGLALVLGAPLALPLLELLRGTADFDSSARTDGELIHEAQERMVLLMANEAAACFGEGVAESADSHVTQRLAGSGRDLNARTQMLAAENVVDLSACRAVLSRAASLHETSRQRPELAEQDFMVHRGEVLADVALDHPDRAVLRCQRTPDGLTHRVKGGRTLGQETHRRGRGRVRLPGRP